MFSMLVGMPHDCRQCFEQQTTHVLHGLSDSVVRSHFWFTHFATCGIWRWTL